MLKGRVVSLVSGVVLGFAMTAAVAQTYPTKPIRLVVPFTPGGGTDILGRTVAQKLSESYGQSVVVDNRPGAGGTIGAEIVARAAPDGYTILMVSASYAVNANLYKLPFNPIEDLAPVSQVATVPFVLTSALSFPATNVRELVELAKAKPGTINFASSGLGSSPHLAGELLKMLAGIDIVHIPYKGGGPALTDQVAGRVELLYNTILQALPMLHAGKVRALAVGGLQRSAALPDVPTIADSGVPGYDFTNWFGVLVPGATPKPIIATLQRDIAKHLHSAELRQRLTAEGAEPVGGTPEAFAQLIAKDIDKIGRIVKAANVKLN